MMKPWQKGMYCTFHKKEIDMVAWHTKECQTCDKLRIDIGGEKIESKSIVLRKGTEEDIDQFFELYWLSGIEHLSYNHLDELRPKEVIKQYIVQSQREQFKDPGYVFIIAEDNGKMVGVASGHVGDRDEPHVYKIDREGYIDELCVLKEYRKNGIGKMLLDAISKELHDRGAMFIGLGVACQNPAVDFYKKCGFNIKSYWMTKE